MTRRMYDSTDLGSLPPGADLYGGYDDGNWPDAAAIAQHFPGLTVIRITVKASDDQGDMLDVENGDAAPSDAPGWIQRRRSDGHRGPLVYCSSSIWDEVRAAFGHVDVPEPGYFIASYPGPGAVIPPDAVGHQFADHGTYDESVVVDYLPGIDPPPATGKDDMAVSNDWLIRNCYRVVLHREVDPGGYTTWANFLSGGGDPGEMWAQVQDSPEGVAVLAAERKSLGLA